MKQKDITDIVVREMKCFWKTNLRPSEEIALRKAGINYDRGACNYCTGYNKRCQRYIRRVMHYIPIDK